MIVGLSTANTQAVSLLEQGLHQDAIRLLSSAVRKCASTLSGVSNDDIIRGIAPEMVVTPLSHFKTGSAALPEDVFSHPFLMHVTDHPRSSAVPDEVTAASAAVCFFNMGLACHLEWTRRRRNDTRILKQAQAFYARAVASLQYFHLLPRDPLVLLRMAICQNLISLSQEMGEIQAVQLLKRDLAFVLSYADQQQFQDTVSLHYLYQANMLCRSDIVAARAA